jgi:hypothetical protein
MRLSEYHKTSFAAVACITHLDAVNGRVLDEENRWRGLPSGSRMKHAICATIFCLALALMSASQETSACKDLSYANGNQIDYGPLQVTAVRGTAKDAQGVPVPRACVGIFTEASHKLVASTQTNGIGGFELKDAPIGDYRLVAKYEGFSPANAKVRVERSRGKKTLVVQMRLAGLDSGSFVEVK